LYLLKFYIFVYFCRYYGLKPKLDEAYIRIKELERENEFLKWSKVVQDKNCDNTSDLIKKTFRDILTQTQPILLIDKVCFIKKIII
jgi:uncharacterized protein